MYYSISRLLELCSFFVSGVAIIILCFYVVASVLLFYPPRLFSFGTFLFSLNFPLPPSITNSFFFKWIIAGEQQQHLPRNPRPWGQPRHQLHRDIFLGLAGWDVRYQHWRRKKVSSESVACLTTREVKSHFSELPSEAVPVCLCSAILVFDIIPDYLVNKVKGGISRATLCLNVWSAKTRL